MKSDHITHEHTKEQVLALLQETEEKLLQATRNLGHPAYALSSSVTFAIDELREELFEFLEIPNIEENEKEN